MLLRKLYRMPYQFTNFVYQVTIRPGALGPNGQQMLYISGQNTNVGQNTSNVLLDTSAQYEDHPDVGPFADNHTNLILDFREFDLASWTHSAANPQQGVNLWVAGSPNSIRDADGNISTPGVPGYYATVPGNPSHTYEIDKLSLILPDGWTYRVNFGNQSIYGHLEYTVDGPDGIATPSQVGWGGNVLITAPDGKYIWIDIRRLNMDVEGPPIVVPCFTRGSRLLCADGVQRPVEALSIGDSIVTRDRGPQPIRWIGSSKIDADTLGAFPNKRPIRIAAGALGNDRELRVSPQHRMLITGPLARALSPGQDEVLLPAKALLNDSTITVDRDCREVEYFHLLFDRHEVVQSDGAWSESFFPGPYMMETMTRDSYNEIVSIFPELEADILPAADPARPLVKPGQAKRALRGQDM